MNKKVEYDNNSILVAWARKSKNQDKIVMNVSLDAISDCTITDGKVKAVCNLNRIIKLIEDEIEVVAVNHLTTSKFVRNEIVVRYNSEGNQ